MACINKEWSLSYTQSISTKRMELAGIEGVRMWNTTKMVTLLASLKRHSTPIFSKMALNLWANKTTSSFTHLVSITSLNLTMILSSSPISSPTLTQTWSIFCARWRRTIKIRTGCAWTTSATRWENHPCTVSLSPMTSKQTILSKRRKSSNSSVTNIKASRSRWKKLNMKKRLRKEGMIVVAVVVAAAPVH